MYNFNLIKQHRLFHNLSDLELQDIFSYFTTITYDKNHYVFRQKDTVEKIYIILDGKIEISKYDFDGTKSIITIIESGDIFAESIALSTNNISPYNIKSLEIVKVAFILKDDFLKIAYQNQTLFKNIISIMANKNTFLNFKLECLSKRTITNKVFEILRYYFIIQNSHEIILPYNKTQLAEFLFVNRSALSSEMSNMQEQGIFEYTSNNSYILNKDYFSIT